MGIVYKCTNLKNGKVYVGLTERRLNRRINSHYHYAKNSNGLFQNALRKNNRDDFLWEEIDRADTREELCSKEQYWIKHYKSDNRDFGYNLTDGGEHPVFSKTTRKKISKATMGKEKYKLPKTIENRIVELFHEHCLKDVPSLINKEFGVAVGICKVISIIKKLKIKKISIKERRWKEISKRMNIEGLKKDITTDKLCLVHLIEKYKVSRHTVMSFLEGEPYLLEQLAFNWREPGRKRRHILK
jgi:group I intron endonuclease